MLMGGTDVSDAERRSDPFASDVGLPHCESALLALERDDGAIFQ
jgi:hypothetical protein